MTSPAASTSRLRRAAPPAADPGAVRVAVEHPAILGESPFWHPDEGRLYYCDIAGRRVHRFDPRSGHLDGWAFDTEAACVAPRREGGLVLALRDGLWQFDPASGAARLCVPAPYDPARQRFNDGKCDPSGRFWCGTVDEAREPTAALYCLDLDGRLTARAEGCTTSNGLAWSPDGGTLYWADTRAHTIYAFDADPRSGAISRRRAFARFEPRAPDQPLDEYLGRPDGAAVDVEGHYWVAMYEGSRVLRLAPDGRIVQEILLPVRCPTMPCFGGPDLRTLYITTVREKRPAEELAAQPWAGCVLEVRVDVEGLPVNFFAGALLPPAGD
ncbi:MAG TPA: SMP-30/gluconolactonase/LRE family protein [Burkholderiaceae bacterium]|nr:SMP-30/gluconolactonase/LRE family protein [Burkholderiaceae bacterium]